MDELAGERDEGGQGRCEGGTEGLDGGVEGWQLVALEELEVLQLRNNQPLGFHCIELDDGFGLSAAFSGAATLLTSTILTGDMVDKLALATRSTRVGVASWVACLIGRAFKAHQVSRHRLYVSCVSALGPIEQNSASVWHT